MPQQPGKLLIVDASLEPIKRLKNLIDFLFRYLQIVKAVDSLNLSPADAAIAILVDDMEDLEQPGLGLTFVDVAAWPTGYFVSTVMNSSN